MRATCLLLSLSLLFPIVFPSAARAAATSGVEYIKECSRKNVPDPGAVRAVRFVSRDRLGSKRVTRLRIEGKRAADGSRRLLARVVEPPEMEGAMFLLIEHAGENEMYFKTSEMPEPKRINASEQSLNMFGTDFTYEDLQNLQRFNRPGLSKKLLDDEVSGRPVWVVETLPAAGSGSAYKSIVTSVDKETCLPIQIEMYGDNGKVRKLLSSDPNQFVKRGDVWIAHHLLMKDLRDYTETQMLVDSVDVNVEFPDDHFKASALASAKPSEPAQPAKP